MNTEEIEKLEARPRSQVLSVLSLYGLARILNIDVAEIMDRTRMDKPGILQYLEQEKAELSSLQNDEK